MSYGGQHIRDIVKEKDYVILNNMAVGRPWTWVQRGNELVRSCLDIAIGSRKLPPFVKSIIIDKDKQFKPRRVIRKYGQFRSVLLLLGWGYWVLRCDSLHLCLQYFYDTRITQLTDLMTLSTKETLFAGTPHLLY